MYTVNALNYHKAFFSLSAYRTYFILGNNHFLRQEIEEALATQAPAEAQYSTYISTQTDWAQLGLTLGSQGLFGALRIGILRLPEKKLSKAQSMALEQLAQKLPSQIRLIFVGPLPLNAKEVWWKAYQSGAIQISCRDPSHAELPRWIEKRATSMGLTLQPELISSLIGHYESHLAGVVRVLTVAASQTTETTLTLEACRHLLAQDHLPYATYHWTESLFTANPEKTLNILQALRTQQLSPLILLRALQPYLLVLMIYQTRLTPQAQGMLINHLKMAPHRLYLLKQRAQRLSQGKLRKAFHLLYAIECSIKLKPTIEVWSALSDCSLLLSDPQC